MSDILSEIIAKKRIEVAQARAACPLSEISAAARERAAPRGFAAALRKTAKRGEIAVVAEIKKASPSRGLLRDAFEPAAIARAYQRAGASCLSVLTDTDYFMGADQHLVDARAAVNLPVLRKDFMIDAYQIVQSRALGADCVLLIAAALSTNQLHSLNEQSLELQLDVLIEVHDEKELEVALSIDGALIGINNRNLRTFKTDIEVSRRLASRVPLDRFVVSESGISNRADIDALRAAGIGAFLVGEALMRAADPGEALKHLLAA